jgi:DNA-binding MarR family transcriptional regulator
MAKTDVSFSLRRQIQAFIRNFGVLRDSETPCGQPLPLSHAQALSVLIERDGLKQKDLAEALCLDKSSVARLCQRMELAGHIAQIAAADDARAREVSLTLKGKKLAKAVQDASRNRFEALAEAMSRSEHSRVLDALEVLNAAVATLNAKEQAR